jgi:hypothetical protein
MPSFLQAFHQVPATGFADAESWWARLSSSLSSLWSLSSPTTWFDALAVVNKAASYHTATVDNATGNSTAVHALAVPVPYIAAATALLVRWLATTCNVLATPNAADDPSSASDPRRGTRNGRPPPPPPAPSLPPPPFTSLLCSLALRRRALRRTAANQLTRNEYVPPTMINTPPFDRVIDALTNELTNWRRWRRWRRRCGRPSAGRG